ncbi:MAG: hypothetical protein AAFN11_03810 [Chloroflexota bacterium]
MQDIFPAWAIRLLLAGLFAFGSEIILWTQPFTHTPLEWLVRIAGYVLIATLTLDVAQRYRIRDGYDVMVLIAGTAILHSVLINPAISWQKLPDDIITRIIGSDALVQVILWGVFIAWLNGKNSRYAMYQLVGAGWLGMFWGFWMRWTPELRGTFEVVPLTQMALIAIIGFGIPLAIYLLTVIPTARTLEASDLMLPRLGWAVALIPIILLFLYQVSTGALTTTALSVAILLLTLCWLILWLRRNDENEPLLEGYLPLTVQNPMWIGLMMVMFTAVFFTAYTLPLIEDAAIFNQLWLMEFGSFTVGILWLPFVSVVIASRSIDRIMRQGDL